MVLLLWGRCVLAQEPGKGAAGSQRLQQCLLHVPKASPCHRPDTKLETRGVKSCEGGG